MTTIKLVDHTSQPAVLNDDANFRVYTEKNMDTIQQLSMLPDSQIFAMRVVSKVLPFRVNKYVIDELIDWSNVPQDPIFQLVFPQQQMLKSEDFARMASMIINKRSNEDLRLVANEIRSTLNPHPGEQSSLNVPSLDSEIIAGVQHKYRETVLFFPSQGQTCHSYCTFCFRWAQFIGDKDLKFHSREVDQLISYLKEHPSVSDLLVTGGDPMVMKTEHLSRYLLPMMGSDMEQLKTIRIGTKALTFWPHRFVNQRDSDELLRLFEKLVKSGKQVAIMAHLNHWREIDTPIAREAIRRLRDTGVTIRSQGPLLRHINDDAEVWSRMWSEQVNLGIIPYYMFVERDTGARQYFEVPLARALKIYSDAQKSLSGLARTAKGPSMSAGPGKVEILGEVDLKGERVFSLRFLQGRNPDWVHRPFFAKYDDRATWFDQLVPAFGERSFFFESEYEKIRNGDTSPRGYQ